jgi:hypothetical protein
MAGTNLRQALGRVAGQHAPGPDDDRPPVLIHLHIRKTAGSTLNRVIDDNRAGRSIYSVHDDFPGHQRVRVFFEMPTACRDRFDILFGHNLYGIHRLFSRDYRYLFVLREPVARLYSLFNFMKTKGGDPVHQRVANDDFGAFLERAEQDELIRSQSDNHQMLVAAGKSLLHGPVDFEAALADACAVALDERVMYGFTEAFGDFLQRMKRAGTIETTPGYALNVLNSASTFDEAMQSLNDRQRAILDQFTQYDRRFYAFCREHAQQSAWAA